VAARARAPALLPEARGGERRGRAGRGRAEARAPGGEAPGRAAAAGGVPRARRERGAAQAQRPAAAAAGRAGRPAHWRRARPPLLPLRGVLLRAAALRGHRDRGRGRRGRRELAAFLLAGRSLQWADGGLLLLRHVAIAARSETGPMQQRGTIVDGVLGVCDEDAHFEWG